MSSLLLQPATWPHLNLNPEPMGVSMDPDSIARWYQELFRDSRMSCQTTEDPKPSNHATLKMKRASRPASDLHGTQRRQ